MMPERGGDTMEEVFDFREFVISLLRRWKLFIIFMLAFGLLGGAYGYIAAGRAGEDLSTYTATSAASVNLEDGGEIPYWTVSSIMATVDAVAGSDFTYANFADELAAQGLSEVLGGMAEPSAADVKQSVRFYIKGNLLLADVTTHSQELSSRASQAAVGYLTRLLPTLVNHISIVPQDRQTMSVAVIPAPSKSPKALKYGALGAAGGLALSFLWIFLFDVFDPRVRSEEDLRKFGIPVFGVPDGRSPLPGDGKRGRGGVNK